MCAAQRVNSIASLPSSSQPDVALFSTERFKSFTIQTFRKEATKKNRLRTQSNIIYSDQKSGAGFKVPAVVEGLLNTAVHDFARYGYVSPRTVRKCFAAMWENSSQLLSSPPVPQPPIIRPRCREPRAHHLDGALVSYEFGRWLGRFSSRQADKRYVGTTLERHKVEEKITPEHIGLLLGLGSSIHKRWQRGPRDQVAPIVVRLGAYAGPETLRANFMTFASSVSIDVVRDIPPGPLGPSLVRKRELLNTAAIVESSIAAPALPVPQGLTAKALPLSNISWSRALFVREGEKHPSALRGSFQPLTELQLREVYGQLTTVAQPSERLTAALFIARQVEIKRIIEELVTNKAVTKEAKQSAQHLIRRIAVLQLLGASNGAGRASEERFEEQFACAQNFCNDSVNREVGVEMLGSLLSESLTSGSTGDELQKFNLLDAETLLEVSASATFQLQNFDSTAALGLFRIAKNMSDGSLKELLKGMYQIYRTLEYIEMDALPKQLPAFSALLQVRLNSRGDAFRRVDSYYCFNFASSIVDRFIFEREHGALLRVITAQRRGEDPLS